MVLMVLSGEEASHFFRNGDMSRLKNWAFHKTPLCLANFQCCMSKANHRVLFLSRPNQALSAILNSSPGGGGGYSGNRCGGGGGGGGGHVGGGGGAIFLWFNTKCIFWSLLWMLHPTFAFHAQLVWQICFQEAVANWKSLHRRFRWPVQIKPGLCCLRAFLQQVGLLSGQICFSFCRWWCQSFFSNRACWFFCLFFSFNKS